MCVNSLFFPSFLSMLAWKDNFRVKMQMNFLSKQNNQTLFSCYCISALNLRAAYFLLLELMAYISIGRLYTCILLIAWIISLSGLSTMNLF